MKPVLKYIIRKLRLTGWLDAMLFILAKWENRKINRRYKDEHPGTILPDDYDLYETYQLHYQKFIEDGALAAAEIIEWTKPYLNTQDPVILDWGCGVGRIARHINHQNTSAKLFACDVDEKRIEWNQAHYNNIDFTQISYLPPTNYPSEKFDLIYGISIFTHIDAETQDEWLKELHRILKHGAILLITTQGEVFLKNLLPTEKKLLSLNGILTQNYCKKGHRMMSTYHQPDHFKQMISPYFIVREFYNGKAYPEKMGRQDLWILQKK